MKVLESLFKVESMEVSPQGDAVGIRATLAPRRDSAVYRGHFPEQPITPGVLMIAAVVELLESATSSRLRLQQVKNVKYLSMMTPDDVEGSIVEATLLPDGMATATYSKGDTTFSKMKLLLLPKE